MRPVFTQMDAPALVVLGDHDDSPLTTRGPDWSADPYTDSPGEKHLLTLVGGEHSLGGIPGYDVRETTDEDPDRVLLLRDVAAAFLQHALGRDGTAWGAWTAALSGTGTAAARLDSKG